MAADNREKSLGYAIGKTNWYLKTLINKLLKDEGFTITNEQWIVLKAVFEQPGQSQTEVSQHTQKDKTNITRILDLLEKNECIQRKRDGRDRRMNRIYITEHGKTILKAVTPITQKIDVICSQAIPKKKKDELIQSLDIVCNSIKTRL